MPDWVSVEETATSSSAAAAAQPSLLLLYPPVSAYLSHTYSLLASTPLPVLRDYITAALFFSADVLYLLPRRFRDLLPQTMRGIAVRSEECMDQVLHV